jgi:hypothetical protein
MAFSPHSPNDINITDGIASLSTGDDTNSDYGPEFTPEEDELVNEILLNVHTELQLVGSCADDNKAPSSGQQCGVHERELQLVSSSSKLEGEAEGKPALGM